VTLADEQHFQMHNVMDVIDQVATDDLQHIFEEGECQRKAEINMDNRQ